MWALYNNRMKITTKFGDLGETSLFGGQKVPKDCLSIELIGQIDELQAFVGACKCGARENMEKVFERIQADLYRIMAFVGFGMKYPANIESLAEVDVEFLEDEITKREGLGGDVDKFILPGNTEFSAKINVTRTVCRRVERFLVKTKNSGEPIPKEFLQYLNRLSDFLFVVGLEFEN
jgi:cob(I)alamin adenosyltransferase